MNDSELVFGDRLRAVLAYKGISQKQLAKTVRVGIGTVNRWVHGKQGIEPENRVGVEAALDLPSGWLLRPFPDFKALNAALDRLSHGGDTSGLALAEGASGANPGAPCHTEAYAAFLERLAELVRLGVPSMTIDEVRSRLAAIKEELDQRAAAHSG
jgi:transcriptional regulator with XRE-family HTH domain